MKNAKKLLGMVLSLCLVLTLLAGLTAMAEVENLLKYPEDGWHSTVKGEKVPVSFDGVELPFNFTGDKTHYELQATSFAVEQGTTYRLSFSYKLPEGGTLEYRPLAINASYSSVNGVAFADYKSLAQTGTEFKNVTYAFTIENPSIARIQVCFRTAKNAALETPAVIKNATVVKIESEGSVTNGSFEMVQNGVAIDTTGGELITEGALYGNNMMKVTAAKPMSLTLTLAKISTNAKLRGFVKAVGFTSDSKATLSVKTAGGTALAEKSFNLAPVGDAAEDTIWNIKADTWEFVRMSDLPYSDGMKLEAKVEGEGALYLDDFTFEKSRNLLKNAAFNNDGASQDDRTGATWKIEKTTLNTALNVKTNYVFLGDSYIVDPVTQKTLTVWKNDGNCPDGQNYLYVEGDGHGTLNIVPGNNISVKEGEKYRFSVWMKSNVSAKLYYNGHGPNEESTIGHNYTGSNRYYFAVVRTTNGEWKHIEFTFTIPKGMTSIKLQLRSSDLFATGNYMAFNVPSIEKIEENEVNFYTQDFTAHISDKPAAAFLNITGEPIKTAVGLTGTISAIATTVTPHVTSEDIVILAAYKVVDGKKNLVKVLIGEKVTAPTSESGVKDLNGNALDGVAYPTATIHTDELGDATEIRAFLWNSVSGLTPTGTAAKLAR